MDSTAHKALQAAATITSRTQQCSLLSAATTVAECDKRCMYLLLWSEVLLQHGLHSGWRVCCSIVGLHQLQQPLPLTAASQKNLQNSCLVAAACSVPEPPDDLPLCDSIVARRFMPSETQHILKVHILHVYVCVTLDAVMRMMHTTTQARQQLVVTSCRVMLHAVTPFQAAMLHVK